MTSFRNRIIAVGSVLLLAACGSRTVQAPDNSIPGIRTQLQKDSVALQALQDRYQQPLREQFRWCDSMLAFIPEEQVNDYFDVLNLTQAYLGQFDEMLPVMRNDLAYINQQLDLLQQDIETHYLSDSLAQEYLKDEKASADTLHYRIQYFEDRLSQQEKAIKKTRKDLGKAVSK